MVVLFLFVWRVCNLVLGSGVWVLGHLDLCNFFLYLNEMTRSSPALFEIVMTTAAVAALGAPCPPSWALGGPLVPPRAAARIVRVTPLVSGKTPAFDFGTKRNSGR